MEELYEFVELFYAMRLRRYCGPNRDFVRDETETITKSQKKIMDIEIAEQELKLRTKLETISGSKKVGKKRNIGRYRIKYSFWNTVGMEIQLAQPFEIIKIFSHLKYSAVFKIFTFIWTHSRQSIQKKIQNMVS